LRNSASGQTLTYSASGLPAGLSINSSSGLISGTYTAKQLLGNPGFESGNTVWSATADVILNNSETEPYEASHSGSWFAWLDGYGTPHTDTVAQAVTLPTGCAHYTLSFWKHTLTPRKSGPRRSTPSRCSC
jgi:hypothetical protein